jgi:ribonucleotide monophosphatase NagD (HAD superfamily)
MGISAGKELGCKTVLVTTGPTGGKEVTDTASFVSHNLLSAVQWIIQQL